MARRLTKDVKLRELDAVVRYGGEEFAIILPHTPNEGACILAQRVSDQIGVEPFMITTKSGERTQIKVTASIGIAEYTSAAQDPLGKKVQRQADTCLYILKGKEADNDGVIEDRRGGIACNGRVITRSDIEAFKVKMRGTGRSSLPPQA
jgi:diguanylate cyclase (GGDEF)-like protein